VRYARAEICAAGMALEALERCAERKFEAPVILRRQLIGWRLFCGSRAKRRMEEQASAPASNIFHAFFLNAALALEFSNPRARRCPRRSPCSVFL
jgi:hypothetical protein